MDVNLSLRKHQIKIRRISMSKPKKDKFYLVQEDILPEAIKKTIKVKENSKAW